MFCPNCGAENEDDAKFCNVCGASLEEAEEKIQGEAEYDIPITEANSIQNFEDISTDNGKSASSVISPEMIVIGIMGVIIIIGVIIGGVILFNAGRTNGELISENEVTSETTGLLQMEEEDIEENEEESAVEEAKEDVEEAKENAEEENVDYLVPDAADRNYTAGELAGFTKEQLRLARNEIYARHGRRFKDAELQAYFDSKPWYNGTIQPDDFDESVFNQFEKDNISLIKSLE